MNPELTTDEEKVLRDVLSEIAAEGPRPPRSMPISLQVAVKAATRRLPEPQRTLRLIAAESPIVLRGRMVPALVAFIAAVFVAANIAQDEFSLLLLTAMMPLVTTLTMVMLGGRRCDPAHDLVRSTRTPPGAVTFARTTLVLAVVIVLGMAASLVLSVTVEAGMMALVTAWLGPTVILAFLATLLAQYWWPVAVVSVILASWTALIGLAWLDLQQRAPFSSGLSILWQPDMRTLIVQLVLATALVTMAWGLSMGSASRRTVA